MEQQTIAALRRQAEKRNENMEGGARWRTLDFVLSLILIMLSVFALRTVLFDPVRVDGKSMLDTLTDGEIMLVNRAAFAFSQPKRGDIIPTTTTRSPAKRTARASSASWRSAATRSRPKTARCT